MSVEQILEDCPYGGVIGVDNSRLDKLLSWSKVMRLHAVAHDAYGYMKREFDIGPGYSYVVKIPCNCCVLGHITGILFILHFKYFHREEFDGVQI